MVAVLEGETQEDEPGDEEGRAEPEDQQAGFGFEAGGVAALVAGCDGVVEPVAGEFAEDGGDDGSEVEEAWTGWLARMGRGWKEGGRGWKDQTHRFAWDRSCRAG